MPLVTFIAELAERKGAWLALLGSSATLLAAALFFQYQMDLLPCVKCIYQRTAVIGILVAAVPALLSNTWPARILSLAIWGVSAIWGYLSAAEHIQIQRDAIANPFFATCEIVPNFPNWAPLHEWLPTIFAAPGDCGELNWQFAGLSMPAWMQIIFACYSLAFIAVVFCRLLIKHKL